MILFQAPFYLLFGALYLGGTIVGLLAGAIFLVISEARSLMAKLAEEGLGHKVFYRSTK